jgi:threonine synthase
MTGGGFITCAKRCHPAARTAFETTCRLRAPAPTTVGGDAGRQSEQPVAGVDRRGVPALLFPKMAGLVTELVCITCGKPFPHGNLLTCPVCGPTGVLDVRYDYDRARITLTTDALAGRPANHWRYREVLPIQAEAEIPPVQIGWTPVHEAPRLARYLGVARVFLKDESRNPTASFKDRASSIGILKAREFGFDTVACASTGNAASSLAGLAASAGLRAMIFVPQRAPEPKIAQLLVFGATVFRVNGSYEDAFDLCRAACEEFGWYNRSSGINPYLVEGKKTAGLEIGEQFAASPDLNGGALPDWVVVSVGDGCTIGGIGKGLHEAKRLGISPSLPRLLGVQAEGASPVAHAFATGKDLEPSAAVTVADSIAVGTPRNWRRAIAWTRASRGTMVTVPDDEIIDAIRTTARLGGVFGEPAGVAGVAGLKKAVQLGVVRPGESALVVITGNGLKDIQSARQAVGQPLDIAPRLDAVRAALRQR